MRCVLGHARHAALALLLFACGPQDECQPTESPCGTRPGTFLFCFTPGPSHGAPPFTSTGGSVLEEHECEGIAPVCRPLGEHGHECVDEGELLTCRPSEVAFEHVLPRTSRRVEWTDVDGDRRLDLLFECDAASGMHCGLWLARGLADGEFGEPEVIGQFGAGSIVRQLGDIDGDGRLDGVVQWIPSRRDDAAKDDAPPPPMLDVLLGGEAAFTRAHQHVLDRSATLQAVGDLDADGAAEIVLTTVNSVVVLELAAGELVESARIEIEPEPLFSSIPTGVVIMDLDGSGRPALIVMFANLPDVYRFQDGRYVRDPDARVETAGILADIDGDGATDRIDTGIGPRPPLEVKVSNRDGTFMSIEAPRLPFDSVLKFVADFDGDEQLDVAVLHGERRLSVLPGQGDGRFESPKTFAVDHSLNGTMVALDADGDGSADLVDLESSQGAVRATVLPRACL